MFVRFAPIAAARAVMLDLTERLVAQSIRAISRRAARADSFEAWRFLDESATGAAILPHTREATLHSGCVCTILTTKERNPRRCGIAVTPR
jgi:hypothetical protein